MQQEEAELIGYLKGDGHISYKEKLLEFGTVDRDLFDYFVGIIYKKFGKCGYIRTRIRKQISTIFRTRRRDIYNYCLQFDKYGTFDWEVPKVIKQSRNLTKKAFIVGLIEAEGTIDTFSRRIVIYSANYNALNDVKSLFSDLRIHSSIYGPHAGAYRLRIFGIKNLKKILEFKISSKRKREKLESLIYYHENRQRTSRKSSKNR